MNQLISLTISKIILMITRGYKKNCNVCQLIYWECNILIINMLNIIKLNVSSISKAKRVNIKNDSCFNSID